MSTNYKVLDDLVVILSECMQFSEFLNSHNSIVKEKILETKNIVESFKEIGMCNLNENYESYLCNVITDIEEIYQNINVMKNMTESERSIFSISDPDSPAIIPLLEQVVNLLYGLELLAPIKEEGKNIVLIGANGSGKSSFANYLKKLDLQSLLVIPAQKHLYMSDYEHDVTYQADGEYIREKLRSKDFKKLLNRSDNAADYQNILTALINEHVTDVDRAYAGRGEYKQTLLLKMMEIFHSLIPHIELKHNVKSRIIEARNTGGETYHFNNLSDGEKAIIYYISCVLLASEKGLIIIDEPETYINPALYKRLWDILVGERSDCQFIFITHSMDFIVSRPIETTNIYWIKQFVYPHNWEIEKLPHIRELPALLVTELIASSKPILFCEGAYESLDYKVYNVVFSENYSVYPVGGHVDVINFTKAFNASENLHNNRAIGIIDRDLAPNDHIQSLEQDKIFTLHFNEVEMLFFWEPLIQKTLSGIFFEDEITKKILDFKCRFFQKMRDKKNEIVISSMKKRIELYLMRAHLNEPKKVDDLSEGISQINKNLEDINKDLEEIMKEDYESVLQDFILQENYLGLLRYCNLKKVVSKEIANQALDNNYVEKALVKLSQDQELQKLLRKELFSIIP